MPLPEPLAALADRSASPAAVHASLNRLRESAPAVFAQVDTDLTLASRLVAVLAASRSMSRLIGAEPEQAIETLTNLDLRAEPTAASADQLVTWRNFEFLRVTARDLIGIDALEQVGAALAALGRDVLDIAYRLTETDAEVTISIIGMGKLGGNELNYSSDIDILFVGEGSRSDLNQRARAIMDIARRCFRVDANLRPEGRDGPLVRSVESYEAYWNRWAEPWEFQALLKARPAAGDTALSERWLAAAQDSLWSRPFDTEALRSLRSMKARTELEVARKGLDNRELKRGPGGIRDIEFTVQLLQLVHGHLDTDLRGANTLLMIEEMSSAGYIDEDDARSMASSYRVLREVEHRLQLVDEQQVHTLPNDDVSLDQLARVMGRRDDRTGTAAEQLEREIRHIQATVRAIHERVYFRPLLEAFATSSPEEGVLGTDAAAARLRAFGFTDTKRTEAAMGELTRGMNRSSRLMQQLLPLLLDWLSQSPDPDLGLLLIRNLLTGPRQSRQIAETFRESPAAAQSLCLLAGTSRFLGDILAANPDLVSRLPEPNRLSTKSLSELVETASSAVDLREGLTDQQHSLHRWQKRNLLGIAARDIFGQADVKTVGIELTRLAEAALETALHALEPTIAFAVIGLGRLGGAELAYSSDLDVIFVHDGNSPNAPGEARRLATSLMRVINGATPSGRLYEIDCDLRPEGKNGPLSRSLDSFVSYWQDHAETWERQAMTRARVVAGDHEFGDNFLSHIDPYVWDAGLNPENIREIRRMKARIEAERIPLGEDPDFHLKLGRGSLSDIEFTAQMLQLQYGVKAMSTIDALRALTNRDVLTLDDATTLIEAYEFCEQVRNRWFLVNSGASDSLPSQPEALLWLARALDTEPGTLRERYRRVTRRSRTVVERVFYGLPTKG